jgi:hypothetical protein
VSRHNVLEDIWFAFHWAEPRGAPAGRASGSHDRLRSYSPAIGGVCSQGSIHGEPR